MIPSAVYSMGRIADWARGVALSLGAPGLWFIAFLDSSFLSLPEITDGAYHFLAEGETIWDLARLYDKPVDEIMERNELSDDDVRSFRTGQPIIIPGITADRVRAAAPREPRTRTGITHEVTSGETIWDLAQTFGVSVSELMAANGLDPDGAALVRAAEVGPLAGNEDLAGIALIRPGQDLHERRLAGRVVADQPEDLAGIEHEIDVDQRLDRAERLGDLTHLDDRRRRVLDGLRNGPPPRTRVLGAPARRAAGRGCSPGESRCQSAPRPRESRR